MFLIKRKFIRNTLNLEFDTSILLKMLAKDRLSN